MAGASRRSRGALPLALWAGLLPAPGLGTNRGQSGCPCIEWSGLDRYVSQHNGQPRLGVRPSGSGGTTHWYPSDYGTLKCQQWDANLPPYCADASGTAKLVSPGWCQSEWCYVNKNTCNLPMIYRSSYFPNEEVYYSYSTCGASNTFDAWFRSGASTVQHQISELINITASYVKATRDEIESAFLTQQANANSGCSLTSGCACGGCVHNQAWGQQVSFTDTMALTSDSVFECLGMIVSETYKRVAGREYNNASRIAYMYMGWQADGSYMQWPGVKWCPTGYDPRFRDWYAGPAAGPKDIVIVIDRSGSMMSRNRLNLAKSAAKAVLRTLTWVDMVTVIGFSGDAVSASSRLAPATDANKQLLEAFIGSMKASGSTNFVDALNLAMDMLTSARGTACLTSACAGALLFLTDGQPDSWGEGDYGRMRSKNSAGRVRIFSYALGTGANTAIPRRLAQEHRGEFHYVPDGGNLNNAMASYYKIFADQYENTDIVRWILYREYITNEEMLAGCLPIYDRRTSNPSLLGVTCMDLNIIVDLPTLRRSAGWQDFQSNMEVNSRRCSLSEPGRLLTSKCGAAWAEVARDIANGAVHSFGALAPAAGVLAAVVAFAAPRQL